MKSTTHLFLFLIVIFLTSCSTNDSKTNSMKPVKVIFLHHSTGQRIWQGDISSLTAKFKKKVLKKSALDIWMDDYNKSNSTNYQIKEQAFPKREPYGWNNYPYDYYNIWIKNAGDKPFMEEPTLEMLTKDYNVIVWKHCYPVSDIKEDIGIPDIDSEEKRIENYKLQYNALKEKMHQFPDTKFVVWTGAALLQTRTSEDNAKRAKEFFNWVTSEWNEEGDNIYIWDFRELETEGDIYLKPAYASGEKDNHPNNNFSGKVLPLFTNRLVDIIENDGSKTNIKGEKL